MPRVKVKLLRIGLKQFSKKRFRYLLDFLFFAIGFGISSALALFVSILINKNLTKFELGNYSYNKAALELAAMALTLTVHRSYLRFNTQGKSLMVTKIVRKHINVAFVLLSLITYALSESPFAILFALFVFFEERQYLMRSLMDVFRLNLLKIGSATVTLLSIWALIHYNLLDADLGLFAYGLGFAVALLFGSNKYEINDDSEVVTHKMVLLFSVPALGAILIKLLLDFTGQFFLKTYFDYTEVAKYAIGLRVLLSIQVVSSLLMMFYPMVYYREIEKRNWNSIMKLRGVMLLIMAVPSTWAFLFPEVLFNLMGAKEYLAHVNIFRVLIISEMVYLIGTVFGTFLGFALKTYLSLVIMFLGLIFNIIVLWLFVPAHGALVAAFGVLSANIVIMIAHFLISFRLELGFVKDVH